MLEFIICDDDKYFLNVVEDTLNKMLIKRNMEYSITKFYDYDNDFLMKIKNNCSKRIYILDIEMKSRSGITIGKMIRKNDYYSPIIYLTGHEELSSVLSHQNIMFLTCINKFDEFKSKLKLAVNNAIDYLDINSFLEFVDKGIYYSIRLSSIICFVKEKLTRNTIVVTTDNNYSISKPITFFESLLPSNFVRTHRSCIVNKEYVDSFDFHNKCITFSNGFKINYLSSKYKEDLV